MNYNVKFFLEQCLYSVTRAAKSLDAEIIVVDNNSSDGSRLFFEGKFPGVTFLWIMENLGFAKANNKALIRATGKYILFLNPDTLLPEDCLVKSISFFESQATAGGLGIHMINGSGKFLKESKRSLPSPITALYKLFGLSALFPTSRLFNHYYAGHLEEGKNNEVDVLSGAFMMIKKEVLDTIGGFDEDFFMYGEDIDLSYRIQQAGYKNFYFAESTIIHFKGESTRKNSVAYVNMFYRAMQIFVDKHHAQNKAGLYNVLLRTAIWIRALISFLHRFMQWIAIPFTDTIIILFSFWVSSRVWDTNVSGQRELLFAASFFIFSILFLTASYLSGAYRGKYKQSQVNNAVLSAFVVLSGTYLIFPSLLRISAGTVLFSPLIAYLLLTLFRLLLLCLNVLKAYVAKENRRTLIVGSVDEYDAASAVMRSSGIRRHILGRVEVTEADGAKAIGHISGLRQLLKKYRPEEVILCEGRLSFKEIIEWVQTIPGRVSIKFFASGSQGIIGNK